MKCAKCHSDNPPTNKFCSACAAPLTVDCRKCGHGNDPQAKYCGSCGTSLAVPPAAPEATAAADSTPSAMAIGERRQATVMFCDISGYTEMSERLDPEDMADIQYLIVRHSVDTAALREAFGRLPARWQRDSRPSQSCP